MVRRAAATLLAAAWLGGCASVPPRPADWISGRMALQIEAAGPQPARGFSAGFELRGDDRQGELRLLSPLGTQVAVAVWQPGLARLETGDGRRDFSSLGGLAREALGEDVPLEALPDWLAGRPWPRAASQPVADGFEQLGWRVGLAAWAEGRIEVQRKAPPAVRLRVQLERSAEPSS